MEVPRLVKGSSMSTYKSDVWLASHRYEMRTVCETAVERKGLFVKRGREEGEKGEKGEKGEREKRIPQSIPEI